MKKIIIKIDTSVGFKGETDPYKALKKARIHYAADLGGAFLRSHILAMPITHDIQIIDVLDKYGDMQKKYVIRIDTHSEDHYIKKELKRWINYYSKELGGKHLKEDMIMLPSNRLFSSLDNSYFDEKTQMLLG